MSWLQKKETQIRTFQREQYEQQNRKTFCVRSCSFWRIISWGKNTIGRQPFFVNVQNARYRNFCVDWRFPHMISLSKNGNLSQTWGSKIFSDFFLAYFPRDISVFFCARKIDLLKLTYMMRFEAVSQLCNPFSIFFQYKRLFRVKKMLFSKKRVLAFNLYSISKFYGSNYIIYASFNKKNQFTILSKTKVPSRKKTPSFYHASGVEPEIFKSIKFELCFSTLKFSVQITCNYGFQNEMMLRWE